MTGATGLVGSALLDLFGPDDEVHVITRAPTTTLERDNIRVHLANLGAPVDTSSLPGAIDSVIYLAQSENFRDFPGQACDVFDVNVTNLLRLLDYARRAGATSFVSASSGGVYSSSAHPLGEEAPLAPAGELGFYLSTKYCGEILAENFAPFMNVAILRFFFVYGPGQRRTMLIPRLVDNIRGGVPIALQGPDGIRINPIHAADAAIACKTALTLHGLNKINVAGPDALTFREIGEAIGAAIGTAAQFDVRAGAAPSDLVGDTARQGALLGTPRIRFADGIRDVL